MAKIAIINKCGNVGKTTIKEIIAILYPHYKVFSVETLNQQVEDTGEFLKGSQFATIQNLMLEESNLLLDIGGSSYEKVIAGLARFQGSINDIDFFIVPTTPDQKTQIQSIETTQFLKSEGIAKEKILILFNRLPIDDQGEDETQHIKTIYPVIFAVENQNFVKKAFALKENELYKLRNAYALPWSELNNINAEDKIKELKAINTKIAKDCLEGKKPSKNSQINNELNSDEEAKKKLAQEIALARLWAGVKKEIKPLEQIINALEAEQA